MTLDHSLSLPETRQTCGPLDHSAPAKIWLQVDPNASPEERSKAFPGGADVTWCRNSQGGLEVSYVRADLAGPIAPANFTLPEGITRDDTVHGQRYFTQADVEAAFEQGRRQSPLCSLTLQPVINWLDNGCDPREAAKELQLIAKRMNGGSWALERLALRAALAFYAEGNHFVRHDELAWETVSGEPSNLWEDENHTATVEDGSIAMAALRGQLYADQSDIAYELVNRETGAVHRTVGPGDQLVLDKWEVLHCDARQIPPAVERAAGEPDWRSSQTASHEVWKNPMFTAMDRLSMADGAVAFRDKTIANLRALRKADTLNVRRWEFVKHLIGPGQKTPEWERFSEIVRGHPDTPQGFEAAVDQALSLRPEAVPAPYAPLTGRVIPLKTDASVFQETVAGRKLFEIRVDDRQYQCGDVLRLRETVHSGAEVAAGQPLQYTGEEVLRRVVGVFEGGRYGLAQGWVILSVVPHEESEGPTA